MTIVHRALRGELRASWVTSTSLTFKEPDIPRWSSHSVGWAGVPVTSDSALEIPAVAACVHAIAGSVSTLSLCGYREMSDDSHQEIPDRNLPRLWREPSAEMSPEDWIYRHLQAQMLDGAAWGRIVARDGRLSPSQVELVPADVVTFTRASDGLLQFRFDGQQVPAEDVWCVTGIPSRTGLFGVALSERMRHPISVQIAARQYVAQFFRDGAHPTAIIESEVDPGIQGAKDLKSRLMGIVRGNREPLFVPKGTRLSPYQSTPDQSKVVEILRESANDIATFLLMPHERVGGSTGDSMTYSNVEQQQIQMLVNSVRFWMSKLERALSRAVAPQAIYAKFDENDFIRTDLKSKVDAIVAATGGPFLTPDEGRAMDDRPPIAGGDVLRGMAAPVTPDIGSDA